MDKLKRGVLVVGVAGLKVRWKSDELEWREGLLTGIGLLYYLFGGDRGRGERGRRREGGCGGSEGNDQPIRRTPAQDPANDFSAFACIWAGISIAVGVNARF